MRHLNGLRAELLGAIASGLLLATGCGGSTRDDRTSVPVPPVDGGETHTEPVGSNTCSGKLETGCYAREQMESMVRFGTGLIQLEPPRSDAEVAAAFLANGCAKAEFVADGCCNSALGAGVPNADGTCCYQHCTGACCGRPLLVGGEARVAAPVPRADWLACAHEPVAAPEAARGWLSDALLEHASVASFARFTLELLAVGAPAVLIEEAQRAALDEIEHARLCFALARRFGGGALGPGPLDLRNVELRSDLADVVESVLVEGCIGETLSAALAREALAQATDAEVRAALGRIAADEQRHAELAFRFVAWAVSVGGAQVRSRVERVARAESSRSAPSIDAVPPQRSGLGRLDSAQRREVERAVRDLVLAPALATLLAAAPSARAVNQAAPAHVS